MPGSAVKRGWNISASMKHAKRTHIFTGAEGSNLSVGKRHLDKPQGEPLQRDGGSRTADLLIRLWRSRG